jgi:DNA polymerase family A/AAA domain
VQIGRMLEDRGWVPEKRTEKKGDPVVSDEVLETIPEAHPDLIGFAEYHILLRRLGQLANGAQAWLEHVQPDGRIHGGTIHIGTAHSRAKHLGPNIAQVPNPKRGKPLAVECRSLFRTNNDWVFVSCDQKNLQDRGVAHYLTEFDSGAYGRAFLAGADTHWAAAIALGLIPPGTEHDKNNPVHVAIREGAKRFRYAFLFGAGAKRAGEIIADIAREVRRIAPTNGLHRQLFGSDKHPNESAMQRVGGDARRKFMTATPGLQRLRQVLDTHHTRHEWAPGLDGRRVPTGAQYKALNRIVTASEAVICKRWLVRVHAELVERFRYGWEGDAVIVAWVHDEVVVCCEPEIAQQVGELMVRHAKEPGEFYGFKVPLDAEYQIGRSWAGEPVEGAGDARADPEPHAEDAAGSAVGGTLGVAAEDAEKPFNDDLDGLFADPAPAEMLAPWSTPGIAAVTSPASEDRAPVRPPRANGGGEHDGAKAKATNDPGTASGNGRDCDSGGYPHGERRTGRHLETYLYRNHLGGNHTKIEKWLPPGAKRAQYPQTFWARGDWVSKKPEGWQKIPYRLPEMLAALTKLPNCDVFIPEGERDANTLAALGLVATTNSEGATPLKAKIGKWTPELNKWFAGIKRVFILEDNDEVGRKFAHEKARALEDTASDIRIVPFADVPEGEDVTHWLKELGHTKAELLARCEAAPRWQADELESVRADQVVMRAIVWLWLNRFAVGKIGIVAGLPDQGKGQILCYIAARITGSSPEWPNGEGRSPQGNVIILSAEENPSDSLAPRLAGAGADLSRIHFLKMVRDRDERTGQSRKRMFSLVSDLERLRRKILEVGDVKAVLIDPVSAYLGIGKVDSYRDTDVRAVLGPLKELAEELRAAVITVMHFNKKVDITDALLRVSNSLAFVGLPRHVYGVIVDAENHRKLFVRAKNNDAAEADNQTLAFHFDVRQVGADPDSGEPIRAPFIVWEPGYVDVTATEAMQAAAENKSPGERDKAKNLLLTLLEGDREVPVDDIKDTAGGHGISWRTMRRAADDLKVVIDKDRTTPKGKWFWKLPAEGDVPPLS